MNSSDLLRGVTGAFQAALLLVVVHSSAECSVVLAFGGLIFNDSSSWIIHCSTCRVTNISLPLPVGTFQPVNQAVMETDSDCYDPLMDSSCTHFHWYGCKSCEGGPLRWVWLNRHIDDTDTNSIAELTTLTASQCSEFRNRVWELKVINIYDKRCSAPFTRRRPEHHSLLIGTPSTPIRF